MTKEQYFMLCEQLGSEPIDSEIPIEFQDFPPEVQEVINIFTILPDRWEGMSGTYMGKDFSLLPYLFDEIFEVFNKKISMKILLIVDSIVKEHHAQKAKEARQKAKRKSNKGGINIQG